MNFDKYLPRFIRQLDKTSNNEHKAVLSSIKEQLQVLEDDAFLIPEITNIKTSTENWLDEFGSWFGVYRQNNEADTEYSSRIIAQMMQAKSTIPAIESNVKSLINTLLDSDKYDDVDISVFEPHVYLKYFSQRGTMSGRHRFPDATYWRRCVFDIRIPENPNMLELTKMVRKIKSAGIKYEFTITHKYYQSLLDLSQYSVGKQTTLSMQRSVPQVLEGRRLSARKASEERMLNSGKQKIWNSASLIQETISPRNFNPFSLVSSYNDLSKQVGDKSLAQIDAETPPNTLGVFLGISS